MLRSMDSEDLIIEGQGFSNPNSEKRIFAIGDIHGCITALEKLLAKLPVNWGEDYLVFLGDYIDRGPSPYEVVETLISLKKRYSEKIITLMGNHEKMFLDYLKGLNQELYLFNGGDVTLKEYLTSEKILNIPSSHLEFFNSLRLYFETGKYFFVHAGINPEKPLHVQDSEDLLWIRERFYLYSGSFEKLIIFGHTPFSKPFIREDRIGIDTGCVYGGALTAVELPERKFYQVSCENKLWRPFI